MINKSLNLFPDHWMKVTFTPKFWIEYSANVLYQGRNKSKGKFIRSVIEVSKDRESMD